MKRLFIIVALIGLSVPEMKAQTAEDVLQDPAVAASYASRTSEFWSALESQLVSQSRAENISAATLQNIVYFANNHSDRINLTPAADALVQVYRTHDDARYRLLAVAGLHAIGDERSMNALFRSFRSEGTPQVRHVALAALRDYYKR
ncbi:MAG: hypothetical protein JJ896_02305 [Rhodothermales bacterium]|nr:hypothetical protein [Rhodothermales bacterium]MBO6778462.1 hypothetical protein [Rhodothermales bacterium]